MILLLRRKAPKAPKKKWADITVIKKLINYICMDRSENHIYPHILGCMMPSMMIGLMEYVMGEKRSIVYICLEL